MPVLDTEVLFGLRTLDPRHAAAHRHLTALGKAKAPILAPDTALNEFQLVLRAEGKPAGDIRRALLALKRKFEAYGIVEAQTLGVNLLVLQTRIEETYGLSYFDSLIAASAFTLDQPLLSDDNTFDRVTGLRRIPLTE